MSNSAEYRAWYAMLHNHPDTVDPAWLSFDRFLTDMGRKPDRKMILLRTDSTKPFGPGNGYWGSRPGFRSGKLVTFDGKTMNMAEWGKYLGVSRERIRQRLKAMSVEEALFHGKALAEREVVEIRT